MSRPKGDQKKLPQNTYKKLCPVNVSNKTGLVIFQMLPSMCGTAYPPPNNLKHDGFTPATRKGKLRFTTNKASFALFGTCKDVGRDSLHHQNPAFC
jgi:hypothetical protein